MDVELVGFIVGLTLTLLVYSYLFIGDRFPYRLAIHILVGASTAYAAVVVVRQVVWPMYQTIRQSDNPTDAMYFLLPGLLTLFLLLRRLRVVSWLGNTAVALLVGVGAAIALLGTLLGTLVPQLSATVPGPPIRGLLVAVLAVLVLLSFQFTTFRNNGTAVWEPGRWQQAIAVSGRAVLMITFGALFAAALNSSFVLLADRILFFMNELSRLQP